MSDTVFGVSEPRNIEITVSDTNVTSLTYKPFPSHGLWTHGSSLNRPRRPRYQRTQWPFPLKNKPKAKARQCSSQKRLFLKEVPFCIRHRFWPDTVSGPLPPQRHPLQQRAACGLPSRCTGDLGNGYPPYPNRNPKDARGRRGRGNRGAMKRPIGDTASGAARGRPSWGQTRFSCFVVFSE